MPFSKSTHRFPETLGRLIILGSILLLAVGSPQPATQAANQSQAYSQFLPIIQNSAPRSGPKPLPSPTAQQLIAADLAAGRIDANTALLYRAYAMYGDPRLPEQYGGGFMIEDAAFFQLAQDPNLPAEMKARLEPFLVRPDDPQSVYNTGPAKNAPVTGEQAAGFSCDEDNWTFQDGLSANYNFRVHARCTGNYANEILTTVSLMKALWGPMTGLMGWPILDEGEAKAGGTIGIDIYLLDPEDELKRYKNQYPDAENPMENDKGVAPADGPYVGDKSSGYMMINRAFFGFHNQFHLTLAHEFFHLLQHAHNYPVHYHEIAIDKDKKASLGWWFTEASATWAAAHFVPDASAETHRNFTAGYQWMSASLHAPRRYGTAEFGDIYSTYIWPFFMEQELTADVIGKAWRDLETVGSDWDAAMHVLDQLLPFEGNFRRFALRNLNISLTPGDLVQPRYIQLDPLFPDQRPPEKMVNMRGLPAQPRGSPYVWDIKVPALDAEYRHFTFNADILQVELDLSGLANLNRVAVEAVVKERGKPWELRPLTGRSTVKLCNIEELYLIFSNENLDLNDPVASSYGMTPLAESCTCAAAASVTSWNADVSVLYTIAAEDSRHQISDRRNANVSGRLAQTYRLPTAVAFSSTDLGGSGSILYRHMRGSWLESELRGDGPPLAAYGSQVSLLINPQECTYRLYVDIVIEATSASGTTPPSMPIPTVIIHAASFYYPLPLDPQSTIAGSTRWPAHSQAYLSALIAQKKEIDFYFQNDPDVLSILGEFGMDAAQVSWKFTPAGK